MNGFDDETNALLQQIHQAWKSNAVIPDYVVLRDRILAQHDRLDVHITALSTVVRLTAHNNDEELVDATWQDFLSLSELSASKDAAASEADSTDTPATGKSRRNYNDINRRRNLATIAALWSTELVEYYGWSRAGQGQVRIIRACALQYPNFAADLTPRVNAVLLSRHCAAIRHGQGRTLNEARLQPYRDLDLETLSKAFEDPAKEREWLLDRFGTARIDSDITLRDLRPDHFEFYLLQKDRYGLWEPREPRNDTHMADAGAFGFAPSPPSSPPANGISDRDLFDSLIHYSPAPHEESYESSIGAQLTPMITPAIDFSWCPSHSAAQSSSLPAIPSDAMRDVDVALALTPGSSVSGLSQSSMQSNAYISRAVSPPSYMVEHTPPGYSTISSRESTVLSSLRSSIEPDGIESMLDDSATPPTQAPSVTWSSRSSRVSSRHGAQSISNAETSQQKRARRTRTRKARLASGSSRSSQDSNHDIADQITLQSLPLPTTERATQLQLLVSSKPADWYPGLSMEETLHNKHAQAIMSHVEELSTSTNGGPSVGWLTPTTAWATIHSVSACLGHGRAVCEDDADVLYFTASDFVSYANAGQVTCKPCVIKEEFKDHGMHTSTQVMALLKDSCVGSVLPTVEGDSDADGFVRISNDYRKRDVQDPTDIVDGLSRLSFRNLSNAHRPIFTMLPRFRLLETLAERLYRILNQASDSLPFGVSPNLGFNSIGEPGKFPKVCVNAWCGTWMRNLEGVKYCLLVPEAEMATEWNSFAQHGDNWVPRGRERLVLLEEDDVLFVPSGIRVLYTIYSPASYLVEGGLVWDKLNILATIRSATWYYQHQFPTESSMASKLPQIFGGLRQIVHALPDDFRGDQDKSSFLETVDCALQDLEEAVSAFEDSSMRIPGTG